MPSLRDTPGFFGLVRRLGDGLLLTGRGLALVWGALWRLAWLAVRRAASVVLALVVLFEQWGWRPLSALLARLARFAPIAASERFIAALPPYGALAAFGAPVVLLVPLKLTALYLIATGHALGACVLFIGAKVIGTAVVARLYALTTPQLMRIGWFRSSHAVVVPWLHALHTEIRASWAWRYGRVVKWSAKRAATAMFARGRAALLELFAGRTPAA